jgi:hypothetical protein
VTHVPWLADRDVTIWQGDALEVLRTLPDASERQAQQSLLT